MLFGSIHLSLFSVILNGSSETASSTNSSMFDRENQHNKAIRLKLHSTRSKNVNLDSGYSIKIFKNLPFHTVVQVKTITMTYVSGTLKLHLFSSEQCFPVEAIAEHGPQCVDELIEIELSVSSKLLSNFGPCSLERQYYN
ncbi:hypothetical protein T01_14667 [Trichinella spiralis]|uniref:Uncharacterized protein n=1 Tax=Trichinella spiralis TaxID=6334 RepID=A0A0V1B2U6_TRISP|nr:hypothetical protein T01_14667 [Trichinella spiralis]